MSPKAKQGKGDEGMEGKKMWRSDGTYAACECGKERREDAKVVRRTQLSSAVENHVETKRKRGKGGGRERGE